MNPAREKESPMLPVPRVLGVVASSVLLLAGPGCTALQQFAALRQVDFQFDRITDVKVAGVTTAGKDSYDDLSVTDVARLAAAVALKRVPLEFVVHVRGENPSTNTVSARLMALGWDLFLDERPILDGDMKTGYTFEPGVPVDVPVAVGFDAYDMYEYAGKDLFELALSIAGVAGYQKDVRLDLEPTVDTDLGPIRYPKPITIRRSTGG
jgi:hypothetical protein